ncbi:hypothetical protein BBF96_02290 [Anoxybacter fermentans]|uniref:CBS domain-containing protein n=1 Tax=Anoxybacter fermentans TaxID=1323375 RepID=A0A3S9SVH7_9FIRM|nr:CBS domain-containing protein [Anoxybacter fermentans]AZR72323.1 hypothetical protein BBF96_02290 [Anoxybacter fermentans]
MDVIITHEGTDFDGLAAMIAANKIYPDAVPVFPGYLSNQVKNFMALFKDQFQVFRPRDIDFKKIKRIILVDTKDPARVGPFRELLFNEEISKIVYDHHLLDEKIFDFDFVDYTSPVGSTTTILIQRIKSEEIPITPIEATLFALGIYHDTGCLTYSTTTPLDAEMVAFLLKKGARLSVVEKFVELPLNEAQQEVLNVLLDQVEHEVIHGLRIDIYSAVLQEYLLGINNIIHKLRDIREADLYFVVVEMEGRVLIVARSDVDSINLNQFLEYFGGGGHSGAASAVIKGAKLEDVKRKLKKMLHEYIQLPRLAKDIMTTPVKTVPPDATIRQVEEIMLRYGHSGLVIMDEDGIKGIFSRRDLDKVKKHNLSDVPVKGYMTRKVVTVSPNAPISQVQKLMVTHDIGRLPVVDENGELLGIITRTDLLNVLYGEDISVRPSYYGSSLVKVDPKYYNIQSCLAQTPPELFDLFCQIRDLSETLHVEPYLVGGFVRDLLLKRPNKDLDLVIEGDGIEFARKLHQVLGGKLDVHPNFGTATLDLNGFHLDVATARVEYYEYPAALPQVKPGRLKQDLYRRDFTINTLVISLSKEKFGWLIDFFGGNEDLKKGIIRGLHSFTFIDDPTRILRGIKFAVRFGFTIEEETDLLIRQAVEHGVIKELKGPRFWEELKSLLMEGKELKTLQYLDDYGILREIAPDFKLTDQQWKNLKRIDWVIQLFKDQCIVQRWLLVLMVIFANLSKETIERIANDWNLSLKDRAQLNFIHEEVYRVKEKLSEGKLRPSQIYNLLESLGSEELMYLVLISDSQLILDQVLEFYNRLRRIDVEVSGKDIINLGFSPGPLFKEVISKVKEAKLNGKVKSREEELEFIKEYLKERKGGQSEF